MPKAPFRCDAHDRSGATSCSRIGMAGTPLAASLVEAHWRLHILKCPAAETIHLASTLERDAAGLLR